MIMIICKYMIIGKYMIPDQSNLLPMSDTTTDSSNSVNQIMMIKSIFNWLCNFVSTVATGSVTTVSHNNIMVPVTTVSDSSNMIIKSIFNWSCNFVSTVATGSVTPVYMNSSSSFYSYLINNILQPVTTVSHNNIMVPVTTVLHNNIMVPVTTVSDSSNMTFVKIVAEVCIHTYQVVVYNIPKIGNLI